MKILLIAILAFTASSKSKRYHGMMIDDIHNISISEQNKGKFTLAIEEKFERKNRKPEFKPTYKLDVVLAQDEFLSGLEPFHCELNKETVYAIFYKNMAKEHEAFKPDRGWTIDKKTWKFTRVDDPSKVSCIWAPSGDEEYPF